MSIIGVLEFSPIKQWSPGRVLWGPDYCAWLSPAPGLSHSPLPYNPLLTGNKLSKLLSKERKETFSWVREEVTFTSYQGLRNEWHAGSMWGGSLRCLWSRWLHRFPGLCQQTGSEAGWMCWMCPHTGLLALPLPPPLTFSFLLTFTLEDDTWGSRDLSLKSCMTWDPSHIMNTRKLSADWQRSHYLLNLSACVILSNAFALKKSPFSDSHCPVYCYFSPGVRREEGNETISLGISSFNNISLTTLLETRLEFQRLRSILQMTWIYFSLKRRSVS